MRTFDLPFENDELLTQERIFHDQIVSVASEISEKNRYQCWSSWFYPRPDMSFGPVKNIAYHAAPGGPYNEGEAS